MKKFLMAALVIVTSATTASMAQIEHTGTIIDSPMHFVGIAGMVDDALRLSTNQKWNAGAAWTSERVTIIDGFTTTFDVRFSGIGGLAEPGNRDRGADGMAFVIQNAAPDAIGVMGGGIGYAEIPKSVAIELDTWNNGAFGNGDPNANHISVQTAGIKPNSQDHKFSLGTTTNIPNLSDGEIHSITVEYRNGVLSVSVDGTAPSIIVPIDLPATIDSHDGAAWIGFTSSTGEAWEYHDVLRWDFESTVPPALNDDEGISDGGELGPDDVAVPGPDVE
jgi:hypothetical protein